MTDETTLPESAIPLDGAVSGKPALTPEQRALHYIRWHSEAYGCVAPSLEIIGVLRSHNGLSEMESDDLLSDMQLRGLIAYEGGLMFDGWRELTPNV